MDLEADDLDAVSEDALEAVMEKADAFEAVTKDAAS